MAQKRSRVTVKDKKKKLLLFSQTSESQNLEKKVRIVNIVIFFLKWPYFPSVGLYKFLLFLCLVANGTLRVSGSGRGGQLRHRVEVPSQRLRPPCCNQEVRGLRWRQDSEEDRPEGDQAAEGTRQSISECQAGNLSEGKHKSSLSIIKQSPNNWESYSHSCFKNVTGEETVEVLKQCWSMFRIKYSNISPSLLCTQDVEK